MGNKVGNLAYGMRHPVTSEVDYADDEREFMLAMEAYKRKYNRPYPTCREVLAVVTALGYRQVGPSRVQELLAQAKPKEGVH